VKGNIAVIACDSLYLFCLPLDNGQIYSRRLGPLNPFKLNSSSLFVNDSSVITVIHACETSGVNLTNIFFSIQKFSPDLSLHTLPALKPLDTAIATKLTFYDGTDTQNPADKDYNCLMNVQEGNVVYQTAGREDQNSKNELIIWTCNLSDISLINQQLLPRKIFYFKNRTRYKNIGEIAQTARNKTLFTFLLESAGNTKINPQQFNFRSFAKLRGLNEGNLVAYILKPNGIFEKRIIYKNGDYYFVPLPYSGNQSDFVFYLNHNKKEKFAILQLNQL
jgi:hypothetical protein